MYLTRISCLRVERRLVECRHGQLDNIMNCNTRVGAYCTECKLTAGLNNWILVKVYTFHVKDGKFTCQNGELQRDNTNNALYICINGNWKTLCYNEYLWGPTQATVACRELNPGKIITGKHIFIA